MEKEIKNYLSDLDNLLETEHFESIDITDYVKHHKVFNLREFVSKGRELIRQRLDPPQKEEQQTITEERVKEIIKKKVQDQVNSCSFDDWDESGYLGIDEYLFEIFLKELATELTKG